MSERELYELASSQHGAFTRAQAAAFGVSRATLGRRIATGRWEELHRGVFRPAGAPGSWEQALLASCLAWGDGATVSHRAAAALWKIPGFRPGILEITVPRGRKRLESSGLIVHSTSSTLDGDRSLVDAIPVTVMGLTLLDLAAVVSVDATEDALHHALRRKLVGRQEVRRRLDACAGTRRAGAAALRSLLDLVPAVVPESPLETRVLRLIRWAGLPEPECQYEIRDGDVLIARVDFAYPDVKLAIEADGFEWHSGRQKFDQDRRRLNALIALGWRVFHVTWPDVGPGQRRTVHNLRRLLRSGAAS